MHPTTIQGTTASRKLLCGDTGKQCVQSEKNKSSGLGQTMCAGFLEKQRARVGLAADAYSQVSSHYRRARSLLLAAFPRLGAGTALTMQPGHSRATSAEAPMLMQDLVRAPARHRAPTSRDPDLKPSTELCPSSSSGYRCTPRHPASKRC